MISPTGPAVESGARSEPELVDGVLDISQPLSQERDYE
jgi:hypothetical protein